MTASRTTTRPLRRRARLLTACCILAAAPLLASAQTEETRRIVNTICAQCHGADGNSTNPIYPKLAGQPASYIAKQIHEFISGGRSHEQMSPIVAKISPTEIENLGRYFSQMKPARGKPSEERLSEIGRLLYTIGNPATGMPSCDGCHAPDASGGGRFPRLAGQHREYIIKQMLDIREGRRNSSTLMRAVTDRMGELEMKALAAYLSGL